MKRRLSTFELAGKFGLLSASKHYATGAPRAAAERVLDRFRAGVVSLPVPNSVDQVAETVLLLQRIEAELGVEEAPGVLENLGRSLLVLWISDSAYITENFAHGHRLDTALFQVLLHVQLLGMDDELFDKTCAEHLPAIAAANLMAATLEQTPVLGFRIDQVRDCLFALASEWHQLGFTDDLPLYLELLQLRTGMLYLNSNDRGYACGVPELEEAVGEGFSIQRSVLEENGWVLREMWKKVFVHRYVTQALAPALPSFTADEQERVRAACIGLDDEELTLQGLYMSFHLNSLIMPGEVMAFRHRPRFKANGEPERRQEPRPDRVLAVRYQSSAPLRHIMEQLSQPLRRIIESNCLGRCASECALLHLLDMHATTVTGRPFFEHFVLWEHWLLENASRLERVLRERHYPLIVQSFNWIGVYYAGTYYDHRNVCAAFLHWLQLVLAAPWHGRVEGIDMHGFTL
jgi:hypothetical protein